ncbi:MAG: hypothetical protein IJ214_05725 [Clostridia bacterium]|nr:hypothetical protein [Clostridia bacterium]
MESEKKARKLMIIGIVGCLLYVLGDFLYAATGKGQTTETIGMFTKVAYLDMATWRMWVSIFCGFAGTVLYYMGFHQMYGLLKLHVTAPKKQIWVRLFHVAYILGTVAWAWVHAMFMTDALIFKYVYQAYGEMQTAADIANRVLYANAPGMLVAYILCDLGLTVTMITMVWKRIIPLRSTGARIAATLCNPIMLAGVVGNLAALLPWPINQLDHGTESFGHALVLLLGLVLLQNMVKKEEIPNEAQYQGI